MLSPVHLRAVVAVVRSGSFADAARELGYTSSAVSQQVSQLERSLRMVLFEREAQRIRPTSAALLLAHRAEGALAMLDALDQDMKEMALGVSGHVRLGSFPTASRRLLPGALARYTAASPGVQIVLDEEEPQHLVPRLNTGDLDLAVVYTYDSVPRRWPETLESVPLLQEELVLLLPEGHPARELPEIRLSDLSKETWVCTRLETAGAASLSTLCSGAGFEPEVAFRSNDYDVICQFVSSGLGVALVPSLSISTTDLASSRRVVDVSTRRHVQALRRSADANPAIPGMVEVLRNATNELLRSRELLLAPGVG